MGNGDSFRDLWPVQGNKSDDGELPVATHLKNLFHFPVAIQASWDFSALCPYQSSNSSFDLLEENLTGLKLDIPSFDGSFSSGSHAAVRAFRH